MPHLNILTRKVGDDSTKKIGTTNGCKVEAISNQ